MSKQERKQERQLRTGAGRTWPPSGSSSRADYKRARAKTYRRLGREVAEPKESEIDVNCTDQDELDSESDEIMRELDDALRCERTNKICGTETRGNGATCPVHYLQALRGSRG